MAGRSPEQLAETFWQKRNLHVITRNDNFQSRNESRLAQQQQNIEREEREKRAFFAVNSHERNHNPSTRTRNNQKVTADLTFWIKYSGWSYCSKCYSMTAEKLLPKYTKRPNLKTTRACSCSKNRYIVPLPSLIPEHLLNLSSADICILRPIDIHCGNYERHRFGYRQKNGKCHIKWSPLSVEQKISQIADDNQRSRCENAYKFLMNFDRSSYSSFVTKRDEFLSESKQLNLYEGDNIIAIECALWPNLYPFTEWCDTIQNGKESRLSQKVSFFTKVKSCVLDYSLSYELLQFNYDLWLFKTVSGAIASARHMKCSPARALNSKVFSAGYWKKQHGLLIDAVRQYGYPDLFITLSPYEWSFPFHEIIESAREMTGRGPTELAGLETLHISHVLEQVVRGYLCGSNTKSWNNNVFCYNFSKVDNNIKTYFYRFEFQQRGTVHLHLLVWLRNIKYMQHQLLRADIPWENPDCAFLVRKIQPSDKSWLQENNESTSFAEVNNRTVVNLYYPKESFALNLRGYIETVLPALKCRMDVQGTDGRHMVLRYVASYVSKWKDAYSNEALYSSHVLPFQAAYRYLCQLQPCEPEMWLHMTAIKFSWSSSKTKDYIVPRSSNVGENKVHSKYITRKNEFESLSFIEWLRKFNANPAIPKQYKDGTALVSVKLLSPFNDEHFFQELLMNYPHRSIAQLKHPRFDDIPEQLRFYASVVHVMPEIWTNDDLVREHIRQEGNKEYFVDTVMAHIAALKDTLYMWERQMIKSTQFTFHTNLANLSIPLDVFQSAIVNRVIQCLALRDRYYDENIGDTFSDSEEEGEPSNHYSPEIIQDSNVDWRKFTLVTGEGGSGKSHIVSACTQKAIEHDWTVLVACPTGVLARLYSNKFSSPNFYSDTVHSCFSIPVNPSERARVNHSLSQYDLIVLDELSMISLRIARHVLTTISELMVRPVVLVTGDPKQIQPIENTPENRIQQVPSIFSDKNFYSLVQRFSLKTQYRVVDKNYKEFLTHIHDWKPTQHLLDSIQSGRILCDTFTPNDEEIASVLDAHSTSTVLTFTRSAGGRINNVCISKLFADAVPLTTVQCDDEQNPCPIYRNMRVLITQNRNKALNVVNGQQATVHCIRNATIFLKLTNGQIVPIYPVTYLDKDKIRCTCYPFTPCYALTIAKAVGLTLGKVILWLDILHIPPGMAYVALSRVRQLTDLLLLTPIRSEQCQPVEL